MIITAATPVEIDTVLADFSWLPDLSGLTEEEAVAAHGAILCTTCYPSAPLAWTNFFEQEAERKTATYCPGSGTTDWKDGKVRSGFYSGNGGYCGHCGGWAGTTSRYSSTIRKHDPQAQAGSRAVAGPTPGHLPQRRRAGASSITDRTSRLQPNPVRFLGLVFSGPSP